MDANAKVLVRGAAWPLLPLAPAVVLLVGIAVATAIGALGLADLARASDRHAADTAQLLASTLAARLSPLAEKDWLETLQRAARKTGAELMILTRDGDVVYDASLGQTAEEELRRVVVERAGQATTGLGRTRFAVSAMTLPHQQRYLREPSPCGRRRGPRADRCSSVPCSR